MKLRVLFAIGLLSLGGACHRNKVKPPVAAAEPAPQQPSLQEMAERVARRKKAEAARLAKIRSRAKEALDRGREQLREEKNTEALAAFQEAVTLDRDSVDAWLRIAYVYEQEGDELHATEAFNEVKRLWSM